MKTRPTAPVFGRLTVEDKTGYLPSSEPPKRAGECHLIPEIGPTKDGVMVEKKTELVPVSDARAELPPILAGRHTAAVEAQVRSFYLSVADIFERWVTRRQSLHTQRAYRQDVMDFVRFLGIRWPDESTRLFTVSVADVLAFRDQMLAESKAPKTINRRIASLSSLLQVPPGRRLRVSAAHHGPQSGTRPVHPPRLVRPARRDQGPVGDPCPAAHGAPLRRHGVRLPGPGHHQVLPL